MKKVLVIDDDKDIRQLLTIALVEKGYVVNAAVNGQEGQVKMQSFKPDLVLVDMMMPKVGGLEFFHSETNPRTGKLSCKMIAMSAATRDSADDLLESAEMMGVEAVFRKPLDMDLLIDKIDTILH